MRRADVGRDVILAAVGVNIEVLNAGSVMLRGKDGHHTPLSAN